MTFTLEARCASCQAERTLCDTRSQLGYELLAGGVRRQHDVAAASAARDQPAETSRTGGGGGGG